MLRGKLCYDEMRLCVSFNAVLILRNGKLTSSCLHLSMLDYTMMVDVFCSDPLPVPPNNLALRHTTEGKGRPMPAEGLHYGWQEEPKVMYLTRETGN